MLSNNTSHGVEAANACVVLECSSFQSGVTGIVVGSSSVVADCVSFANGANGVTTGSGSTVRGCATRQNGADGILVANSCAVLSNVCTANGLNIATGPGVHVIGSSCRVDGNTCTDADRGISVDFSGNFIARNVCSANATNWSIVVANAVATIVQAGVNGAPIGGNTYAGGLGGSDPNSNFTY